MDSDVKVDRAEEAPPERERGDVSAAPERRWAVAPVAGFETAIVADVATSAPLDSVAPNPGESTMAQAPGRPAGTDPGPRRADASRGLRGRFRLPRRRRGQAVASATLEPSDEATLFSEDCLVFGRLTRPAGRVSDALKEDQPFTIRSAAAVTLDDGRELWVGDLQVAPDELVALATTACRGDGTRRRRTVPHTIVMRSGPYRIRGQVHVQPTADALASLWRRSGAVPLTKVRISYRVGGRVAAQEYPVVIVRLSRIDSVVDVEVRPWLAELEMAMDA
jgi:hypothetical protein